MDMLEGAREHAREYVKEITEPEKYEERPVPHRLVAEMYAAIAQAAALERIAKSLDEMNLRDWKRSE